jgi:hypothetical protein
MNDETTTTTTTTTPATILKALESMVAALQAQLEAKHRTTTTRYHFELGQRYARVFTQVGVGRSAYAFVDLATGDIFKPRSWKGPAKGARANVFTPDYMQACGVYGVARAR